jgi:hypothetical protein
MGVKMSNQASCSRQLNVAAEELSKKTIFEKERAKSKAWKR